MIGTLEGAAAGAIAYYATLAVAAVTQGHGPGYPLRAVLAMFRGNRVLPEVGPFFRDTGWAAYARGAFWVLLMSLLCAVTFLFLAHVLRRLISSPQAVVAVAVVTSLLWLCILLVVFDHPRSPALRRQVMSFGGFRELGTWAFLAAHVAFGLALGVLSARPRPQRSRTSVPAVPSSTGTW